MAFDPHRITAAHILAAVDRIEHEYILLEPTAGYNVRIGFKRYPAIELLRYAHHEMNGELRWDDSDLTAANAILLALGFNIEDQTQFRHETSGRVWKLGCNWGSRKPDFYQFIRQAGIVIGVDQKRYNIGDLVVVAAGHRVQAIACVTALPQPVTGNSALRAQFQAHEIPFEHWVTYAPATWRELQEHEIFYYQLQQGICRVKSYNILKKVNEIWNSGDAHDQPVSMEEIISPVGIHSLNTILYGPPGTGKTYHSIDKAVEIATGSSSSQHTENKKIFDRLRRSGQIEFVTFHQNYAYEDFVVGISPDISSGTLRFEKREGIFKQLAERAKQNWLAATCQQQALPPSFEQVFNSYFSKLIEEETAGVEIPMKSQGYRFKVTSVDADAGRIRFTKQSGGTGHDLLVKNIKGIYEETLDYGLEGLGVYYYPLVEQLRAHAATLQPAATGNTTLQNFVLVIDEINRANISKVFGELITLLEDDKRLGAENALTVTLPNGEKDFGLPPNLYLVGTMNTADKSIALLDIALRRRFEFLGFYPEYEGYAPEAISLLQHLNQAVYEKKKSADYLVGHAYFMKQQSIAAVLQHKIIPLLLEYFSGKTEIVCQLFRGSGWDVSYDTGNYTWNISPIEA